MNAGALFSKLRGEDPPLRPWIVSVVAGFTFAIIALLSVSSPLNHFSTIDPLLYQSYIHNYKELIQLYGYTYYSTRIAWIFPASLAHMLFGDMGGYYVIRILLLGSAASAFSIMVGRFTRWQVSVYAAAWFCLFPFILRAFAHDYVDGAAISYAVLGMACVMTPKPRALLQHLAGGAFFAFAVNAYPLAAIIPLYCAIPWFVVRKRAPEDINLLHIGVAAAGFVLGYGLIAVGLWSQFSQVGRPYELIPLSTITGLSGGGAEAYLSPLSEVFVRKGEYFKAYPLFLLAALIPTWLKLKIPKGAQTAEVNAPADAAFLLMLLTASVTAVYCGLHFIIKAGVISVPWAYLFALPACGVASLFLVDQLTPQRHVGKACAAGVLILLMVLIIRPLAGAVTAAPGLVWLAGGLLLLLAGAVALYPRIVALRAIAIAALILFPLSFYDDAYGGCGYTLDKAHAPKPGATGSYVRCMRQETAFGPEKDLRRGILQLLDDVDAKVPLDHPPGLWYANGTGYADAVGSAFLWQYSRVASTEAGDPGMPAINGFARAKIDGYDYLVLIGSARAEVDAAQRSLASGGYTFTPLLERKVGGDHFSFVYRIEKKQPAG